MLNLLLHNCNRGLFLVLLILLVDGVSAYGFSVSPGILNMDLQVGEQQCGLVDIYAKNQIFSIGDRWAYEKSNDVSRYNLTSFDVGVNSIYDSDVFIAGNKRIKVCFSTEKEGIYHGILMISPVEKNAEIGVWVNLVVGNLKRVLNNSGVVLPITVEDIEEGSDSVERYRLDFSKVLFFEMDFMFFMSLILFFMLLKLRKIKEEQKGLF